MTQTEYYLKSQIIATEEDILRIRQEISEESDIFALKDLEIELHHGIPMRVCDRRGSPHRTS